MKLNRKTQRHIKLQNGIFYALLIAFAVLLSQLAIQSDTPFDVTSNQRHSLSNTTQDFVSQLTEPVTIQVFISPNHDYRQSIVNLLNRYQSLSNQLTIHYIDPDFSPDLVRLHNIQQQGEIVFSKGERQQHTFDLSEQSITNAIMAVTREQDKWLVFIEGHGERRPDHQANFNLSLWADQLKQKGFKLKSINLVTHPHIPQNTAAVIIASPQTNWLEGEIAIIQRYLDDDGNLLWLTEPDQPESLNALAEYLGLEMIPGTITDPNTAFLGIADPLNALVTDYAQHPISQAVSSVTLFPQATAMSVLSAVDKWHYDALLTTPDNVWSDRNPSQQATYSDDGDMMGPLNLAYVLSSKTSAQQRIAVIGDGDFLSNSFLGNASNSELGIALMDWLAQDDALIHIPVKHTTDNQLNLSNTASLFIGLGFFVVLPALLLLVGLGLWWYRRRQ